MAVIAEIHAITVGAVWAVEPPPTRDTPGAWRKSGVRVRSVKVSLPPAIPADLRAWSASTTKLEGRHPLAHAAHHHAWLERIHPFVDGNGRVGRLVLNLLLLQHGYSPAVILAAERSRYLQALKSADLGNLNPLTEIVARAVSGTLSRFLIPNLAGDAKLVPLSALAAAGPYPAVYLRQLVLKGRVRAVRQGNLWLSSRAWLQQYIGARDPRGKPIPRPARSRRSSLRRN